MTVQLPMQFALENRWSRRTGRFAHMNPPHPADWMNFLLFTRKTGWEKMAGQLRNLRLPARAGIVALRSFLPCYALIPPPHPPQPQVPLRSQNEKIHPRQGNPDTPKVTVKEQISYLLTDWRTPWPFPGWELSGHSFRASAQWGHRWDLGISVGVPCACSS